VLVVGGQCGGEFADSEAKHGNHQGDAHRCRGDGEQPGVSPDAQRPGIRDVDDGARRLAEEGSSAHVQDRLGRPDGDAGQLRHVWGGLKSATTCKFAFTTTVPLTVDGARSTGKFAGATGTGRAVVVFSGNLPKLSNGKCDESRNAQPSAKTAAGAFTATIRMTVRH
jgi:hypothetical protein